MNNAIYKVFPAELRKEIELTLRHIVDRAREQLRVDRVYVGFIDDEGIVRVPSKLMTENAPPVAALSWKQGLTGRAMEIPGIVVYPQDKDSEHWYFSVDSLVGAEIAGPIRYAGEVTGAIWGDSLERARHFGPDQRDRFWEFIVEIERALREIMEESEAAADRLLRHAAACMEHTRSRRGYIAVKRIDGRLDYFPVGEDRDDFRNLSQLEGLCGKVLQSGEPMNCPNVRDEPAYVPSHAKVECEIIYPIYDRKVPEKTITGRESREQQVIGIINMENYARGAYGEYEVNTMKLYAEEAVRLARLHRRRTDVPGMSAIQTMVEFSLQAVSAENAREKNVRTVEERIINGLCQRAIVAIGVGRVHVWPEKEWDDCEWCRLSKGAGKIEDQVLDLKNGRNAIYWNLLVLGHRIAVLGLEWNMNEEIDCRKLATVKQLCLMAAAYIQHWRQQYRYRDYQGLVEILTGTGDSEWLLDNCVRQVPHIVGSRHCTIFLRAVYGDRTILVPGPSSCDNLTPKDGNVPFYEWTEDGGLTSYVAFHNRELCLSNLQDKEELKKFPGVLRWAKNLAEEPNAEPHAFMAFPIMGPMEQREPRNPPEVIGVIRTYFDHTDSRFTESDKGKLRTIARLLSLPVNEVVKKYGHNGLGKK